ncbi:MAG: hypothetical protein ACP5HG_12280 [Anaerolineae bacterium]
MRIYDSGRSKGKQVSDFGSRDVTISTVMSSRAWHVATLRLAPNGVLGAHKLATDQLLIIMAGSAKVTGDKNMRVDVTPGIAVFWNKDEVHEVQAGSEGLSAVLIEGDKLHREILMPVRKVT